MNTNTSTKRKSKVEQRRKSEVARESGQTSTVPLWEFTEEYDVPTVICSEMYEKIVDNESMSMTAFSQLSKGANMDMNKSNSCLLICAALCARLDMIDISERFLAESDTVRNMFTTLNLKDKGTLSIFCTMVSILNNEILKSIESAVFTAMRRISSTNASYHSISRLKSSMSSVAKSGIATTEETIISGFNARIGNSNQINFVSSSILEGSELGIDTITPFDSASKFNRTKIPEDEFGVELSEVDLMRMIQERKRGRSVQVEDEFRTVSRPITVERRSSNAGMGFDQILSSTSRMSPRTKKERIDKWANDSTNVTLKDANAKKLDEILSASSSGLQGLNISGSQFKVVHMEEDMGISDSESTEIAVV